MRKSIKMRGAGYVVHVEEREMCRGFWGVTKMKRDYLEDLGKDGRLLLKLVLYK
jgi:hypothetical protein